LKTKWFSAITPVNPVTATGTLTFTGTVTDGQIVIIGTEIYEFDDDSVVTGGHIAVDVSGGLTAPYAVTALVSAITNNSKIVTAVDGALDTVVVTYVSGGVVGNVSTTTTCVNGSFTTGTLTGGINGTPCPEKNTLVYATPYYYICTQEGNESDVAWERFTPATY